MYEKLIMQSCGHAIVLCQPKPCFARRSFSEVGGEGWQSFTQTVKHFVLLIRMSIFEPLNFL